jgi:hypothetical protein
MADPDNDFDVTLFDDLTCARMQHRLANKVKSDREPTTRPSISGTLGTFSGRIEDWPAAKRSLQGYLGQMKNKNNIPYFYVIRDELERPDVIEDDVQDAIWNTPTQGTSYDADNYQVYQILIQWTAGGLAGTHIDQLAGTTDGRSAYELLRLNYEGTDYRQTQINNARHILNHAFYHKDSPTFKFDNYCHRHLTANNDINRLTKITVENTCDFLQTPVLRKYTGYLVHRTSTIGKQVL